jgi:hypothetical protein
MKSFIILAFTLVMGGGTFAKSSISNVTAPENPAFRSIHIPDEKDIHVRALKDFQVRFNNASNVRWFSDSKGFISYFNKDGFNNRAVYDKNGRWQYSLIFYAEDKLPSNVRAAVKSVYFDLTITIVEEVQTTAGMVYIVYMEDKSNIKILKVNKEGDMEIMNEAVKE